MDKDKIAEELGALLDKARTAAGKAATGAGEKVLSYASRAAMKRGLVDRAVTLEEAMETIKTLHARGGLSREEVAELKSALLKRFRTTK